MKQSMHPLIDHYLKPYKKKQRVLLLCTFLQILCSIGVAMSLKTIIDQAMMQKNKEMLIIACASFLLSALTQVYFGVKKQRLASEVSEGAMVQLRSDLLDHYLRLPISEQSKINSGQLLTHCMQDVEALKEMLSKRQVRLITNTLSIAVLGLFLVGMNWKFALLVVACIPFFLLPALTLSRSVPQAEKNAKEKSEELNKIILQSTEGAVVIRHLGAEKDMSSRFAEKAKLYKIAVFCRRIVNSLQEVSENFLSVAMSGLFMILRSWLYLRYKTSSAGVFFSFMTLIPILYGAVTDAVSLKLEKKSSDINLSRIDSILQKPIEEYGSLRVPEKPVEIRFKKVILISI